MTLQRSARSLLRGNTRTAICFPRSLGFYRSSSSHWCRPSYHGRGAAWRHLRLCMSAPYHVLPQTDQFCAFSQIWKRLQAPKQTCASLERPPSSWVNNRWLVAYAKHIIAPNHSKKPRQMASMQKPSLSLKAPATYFRFAQTCARSEEEIKNICHLHEHERVFLFLIGSSQLILAQSASLPSTVCQSSRQQATKPTVQPVIRSPASIETIMFFEEKERRMSSHQVDERG